eukprot:8141220-Pyramimonas_sp.AAC.1
MRGDGQQAAAIDDLRVEQDPIATSRPIASRPRSIAVRPRQAARASARLTERTDHLGPIDRSPRHRDRSGPRAARRPRPGSIRRLPHEAVVRDEGRHARRQV